MKRTTRTRPIGEGKVNMSTTVDQEEQDALTRLAKASGLSRNEYCRALFRVAIARESKVVRFQPPPTYDVK
jgi:hypothetical protein